MPLDQKTIDAIIDGEICPECLDRIKDKPGKNCSIIFACSCVKEEMRQKGLKEVMDWAEDTIPGIPTEGKARVKWPEGDVELVKNAILRLGAQRASKDAVRAITGPGQGGGGERPVSYDAFGFPIQLQGEDTRTILFRDLNGL